MVVVVDDDDDRLAFDLDGDACDTGSGMHRGD